MLRSRKCVQLAPARPGACHCMSSSTHTAPDTLVACSCLRSRGFEDRPRGGGHEDRGRRDSVPRDTPPRDSAPREAPPRATSRDDKPRW